MYNNAADWSVYIIGERVEDAKAVAEELKEHDEPLFYVITSGYDALTEIEGIDKYITTEPGEFAEFTRTEAKGKCNSLVNSASA